MRIRYEPKAALGPLGDAAAGAPVVVAQLGQSLDGRIATPTGKSKYISGQGALHHLHHLRASVDAVIVGVNTVIVDDPLLTVRHVDGDTPARVVIDPSGRLPADRRLFEFSGRVILIRADDLSTPPQVRADSAAGLDEIRLPRRADGVIPPQDIVNALAAKGLTRILIEGGARTLSHAMQEGRVDFLHVTVSPIILGSGAQGLNLAPIDELKEAIRPCADVFAFDDGDVLFACDLRKARRAGAADEATLKTAAE